MIQTICDNTRPGERDLLPGHAAKPKHLHEGLGDLEQGVQGGVHPLSEEALLEAESSVTASDLGSEGHGLTQLPLSTPLQIVIKILEIIHDFPQST